MLSFDLRSKSLSLEFGLFLKSFRALSAIMPRVIVLINDSYRCVHAPNRTIVDATLILKIEKTLTF